MRAFGISALRAVAVVTKDSQTRRIALRCQPGEEAIAPATAAGLARAAAIDVVQGQKHLLALAAARAHAVARAVMSQGSLTRSTQTRGCGFTGARSTARLTSACRASVGVKRVERQLLSTRRTSFHLDGSACIDRRRVLVTAMPNPIVRRLMWAGAVQTDDEIAVEAQHLVPGREPGTRKFAVDALAAFQLSMCAATAFDVIQRQKSRAAFATTGARRYGAAVGNQCFLAQFSAGDRAPA
jgi:hypothetical protein